jgi:S1-C subfamily serine protease
LFDFKLISTKARTKLHLEQFTDGVMIAPTQDSPAAKVGLQNYDLIIDFNHQAVSNSNDLIGYIKKQKVGDQVNLTVVRNGKQFSVDVVLAEKPQGK